MACQRRRNEVQQRFGETKAAAQDLPGEPGSFFDKHTQASSFPARALGCFGGVTARHCATNAG